MWWNNLGWVQLVEGRHAESLKSFDRALALDDSNRLAAQNRAVVLGWLGREREAERVRGKLLEANLAHAEQLVTRNPEDAEAHLELGRCLTRLGRADEALEEARVAVRLGSDQPHVLTKAAAVEARRGNCERAGTLLAQAASIGSESMEALCTRSEVAAICKRADEASEAAERALELNDNDSRAWLAKVQASLAAGDVESALDWSSRVLDRAPLDCCAHAWRGLAERERGDVEAARASLRNAAVINPTCAAKRRLEAALG
jgi:Flp pilus assembly protein TadD